MAKKLDEKLNNLYEYFCEQGKRQVVSGSSITPMGYATIFTKDDFEVLPVPLSGMISSQEEISLMKEMGKLLKNNNSKVKMFMYMVRAKISKKDDIENTKDCLLVSAKDCYDSVRRNIYEIVPGEKKISLVELPDSNSNKKDTLLDNFWKEYRGVKKSRKRLDFKDEKEYTV